MKQIIPEEWRRLSALLDAAVWPGARVGPYRLLQEIGRGRESVVWSAYLAGSTTYAEQLVAVKLMNMRGTERLVERVRRERAVLLGLQHPCIVAIRDVGVTADYRPYLAMDLAYGTTLDAYCRMRPMEVREKLALVSQLARAVAHAHSHLVVHGDLGFSSVLIDSSGTVQLLGFGVGSEPASTATDIYLLGVMLHELLTGVHPGAHGDPGKRLRGAMHAIVMKAVERRQDRYATMEALADDIDRYACRLPVLTRTNSFWHRVRRMFARRHLSSQR